MYESGVLSFLSEAAVGPMRDLIREIGINDETLNFMNVPDFQKFRDEMLPGEDDHMYHNITNSLYSPIDMTNYENTFAPFNELFRAEPKPEALGLLGVIFDED